MATSHESNREKYSAELIKYRNRQYVRILHLDNYLKLRVNISRDTVTFDKFSHIARIARNISSLKFAFTQMRTNNICVTFKVSMGGASATYAYLYAQYTPSEAETTRYTMWCCGGNYESQDGEYRSRVLPYSRFLEIVEKYHEVMEIVERMVVDKLSNSEIAFHADFFYTSNFSGSERQFEDSINSLRLAIKFYIICWIRDYHFIKNGYIENHISQTYRHIISNPNDIATYTKLVSTIGMPKIDEFILHITKLYDPMTQIYAPNAPIECGQKIFPVTAFEAIKVHDINFSIWREIYISNMCTDLILNLVSPSFPCIGNWFFIENTHIGLFDNPSMHVKYRHSNIAESISRQLRDIDRVNYTDQRRDVGPLNSKFMRLSKHIQKSIVYADSSIKLTDLAVCIMSENVGRTFRDFTMIVSKIPSYGANRIFSDIDSFSRHIFEYMYALYCMNTRISIFHGDLHMNNVTIYRLQHTLVAREVNAQPYIVYILRDHVYAFPHFGLYSCIIDFSRAIIGDMDKIREDYGDRYSEIFMKEQRIRIMRILFTHFSKFMERNHEDIERLLTTNLPLMFKIISAIDPFVLCSNMAAMFAADQHIQSGEIKLHPDAMRLITKISDTAETFMINNIKAAIEGKLTSPDDIEWPTYLILRKFFEHYETSEDAIVADPQHMVIDIFNSNNELRYHIDEYDTWGPLLSPEMGEKLRKKYGIPALASVTRWISYINTDETPTVERLLDKYEAREQDVINIEPWMLY